MMQLDIFDQPRAEPPRARRTDPETSHAAADAIGAAVNETEAIVLETLRRTPAGLTTHEVADRTGLSLVTVSPRMRPLVRKGLVIDSGMRRSGPTFAASIVWKAIDA